MYDKNSLNLETKVKVDKTENGYLVTYTFDEKWLEEENREYPVTLANTITQVTTIVIKLMF